MRTAFVLALLLAIALPTACSKATAPSAIEFDPVRYPSDAIAADMAGSNEAPPHGVPSWWDWAQGPVIKAGNNPAGRQAITAWGQVHMAAESSLATNTRVQIRDLAGWRLSRSTGTWTQLQRTPTVWGADYAEDFAGNASWPPDTLSVPGNGLAVRITPGRCFHFYWHDRAGLDPADLDGVVIWFEARLVLDNPSGTDDLASAHFVAAAGADYYSGVHSTDAPAAVAHGKTKYVRREWRRFYMTTLSRDALRANPPPI